MVRNIHSCRKYHLIKRPLESGRFFLDDVLFTTKEPFSTSLREHMYLYSLILLFIGLACSHSSISMFPTHSSVYAADHSIKSPTDPTSKQEKEHSEQVKRNDKEQNTQGIHIKSKYGSVKEKRCPTILPEGMACIPEGTMTRGFSGTHTCTQWENVHHKTDFGPQTEVWIQTFLIDKTEVTYEAYQQCRKEKKCNDAHPTYQDFNRPNQAMTGVSWFDAQKYCMAQNKRLPTEAEWEKAARGTKGNSTPFAQEKVSCTEAVIKDKNGRSCGIQKTGKHPRKGRVWEVAQKPAGIYGLFDMVGNAEEWVSDWFSPSLDECGQDCLGVNPQGPCAGKEQCPDFAIRGGKALKMVKGGSWYWPASDATAWHRRPHVPTNKPYHHFGFRCAKDISTPKENQ
jgi:sulfatase modifying factor 1